MFWPQSGVADQVRVLGKPKRFFRCKLIPAVRTSDAGPDSESALGVGHMECLTIVST